MIKTTFQYYSGNIYKSVPLGTISLSKFISKTAQPKPTTIALLKTIRTTDQKAKRDKLKTQLPSFTPSVFVNPGSSRKYDNIDHFTGLAMLDFDSLPDTNYAKEFKEELFNEYPYIKATWLSSSGLGVRGIVNIPVVETVDQFKLHYAAIQKELEQYKGFDTATKNAILPLFYSYDPDILHRDNPQTFTDTYKPIKPSRPKHIPPLHEPTEKYEKWAIANTKKSINKITGNGHPQLRAAAYAMGGYVAAGYVAEFDAVNTLNRLIDSNSYLSQKSPIYKRTAKEMIRKGQSEPLHF